MLRSFTILTLLASAVLATSAVQAQTIYTYNGNLQTYLVPAGVDELFVRLWGAGGGGRTLSGGGGAFVSGFLSVTPLSTLDVLVGGGGPPAGGAGGFGGGGNSGLQGAGGGRSAIIFSGTDLVDAGAGGGGAPQGPGGAGGLTTGQNGFGPSSGGGGAQANGGPGGFGGNPGNLYLGGSSNGAGGGSGYYGGGSGNVAGGSGGGGGSSLTSGLTGFVGDAGSGATPGGMSDPFYIPGVGEGGPNNFGGNGEVVITPEAAPEPGSLTLFATSGLGAITLLVRKRCRK